MPVRPVPLFRDPAHASSPPLTDEALAAAQAALGPLPAAYLEALRTCNGGKLRRDLLPLEEGPFAPGVRIPYLLGVGPGGLPALQALVARWRYPVPEGLLLCSDGPRALLLRRRGAEPDPAAEPEVVWVDLRRPAPEQVAVVARDAQDLLRRLVDGSPHPAWVLAPELTLSAVQARLRPAGWAEVERHYGVYRFRDVYGAELRVEPNHERDGGGLHYAEYAERPLVARLVERGQAAQDSARALDALLAPEGLRVHSPHPASR